MGEIIVRKVRGMNWKAKLSLVLIFTMIFSGFMYQGGYSPRIEKAEAVSGDVILLWDTANGAVPGGWTSISDAGGAFYGVFPRAASTYGASTAGSDTHTDHSMTFSNQTAGASAGGGATGSNRGSLATHSHSTWTPTVGAGDVRPPFKNLIFIVASNPTQIPANAIAVFDGALPSGFTRYTAMDGIYLRGSSDNATGGTATHTHTVSSTSASFTGTLSDTGSGNTQATSHTHTLSGSLSNAANNTPPYLNVIFAYNSSGVAINIPNGLIAFFDATPTGNWTTVSNSAPWTGNFLVGSATFGGTGGSSAAHGHGTSLTITSDAPSVTRDCGTGATAAASGTHTHNVTYTVGNSSSALPVYRDVILAKYTAPSGDLTVGDGTTLGTANAPQGSTNRVLDSFTMAMSAGSGSVATLTVTGSANFNSTNIPTNGVKIYRDAGTPGAYDSGIDTLLSSGSTAISGNATTVTLASSETVTTTAANYIVTVDITSGATLSQSFTGTISAATGSGIGTPVDNDTGSATLTITVASQPSTIDSCSGCHPYSPTFADGTARNTPAGQFPGSHNSHVQAQGYVCSVCHVIPASEVSGDFKHRNGLIEMANPINGNAGAAYGKGTSWAQTNSPSAFTACTNTYCHKAASPAWGSSSLQCNGCHGANNNGELSSGTAGHAKHFQSVTAPTAINDPNAHTSSAYVFSCSNCHPTSTHSQGPSDGAGPVYQDAQIGGTKQSGANYTQGGSSTTDTKGFNYTNGACSNVCHTKDGSTLGSGITAAPAWNGTNSLACGYCHSKAGDGAPTWTLPHTIHVNTYGVNGGNTNINCEVCHTGTAVSNIALQATTAARDQHPDTQKNVAFGTFTGGNWSGTQCSNTYCHSSGTSTSGTHANMFWSGTMDTECDSCHGGNSTATTTTGTGKITTNAHAAHIDDSSNQVGFNVGCQVCHGATVSADRTLLSSKANHVNKVLNIRFDNGALIKDADLPTYNNLDARSAGSGATRTPGGTPASCGTVYCHSIGNLDGTGAVITAGSANFRTVAWNTTIAGCDDCHGDQAGKAHPTYTSGTAGTTTANSHATHIDTMAYSCDICHISTTTSTSIPPTTVIASGLHLNRAENVNFNTATAGTGATWVAASKTCSNTSCHGGSTVWGDNTTSSTPCVECHGVAGTTPAQYTSTPALAAPGTNNTGVDTAGTAPNLTRYVSLDTEIGAHDGHLAGRNNISDPITCNQCHTVPANTPAGIKGHLDGGNADMTWGSLATTGAAPASFDSGTHTCSTVYCHNPEPYIGSQHTNGGTDTTPTWNDQSFFANSPVTTTECGKCHYYSASVNCSSCHYSATAGDFVTAGNGPTTFANKALHIDGTITAQGGDCISCHNDAKGSRRAMSTELTNLAWSHKKTASGSWTKYDCGVCHMEGDPVSGNPVTPYHSSTSGNGILEFRDPDTGLTIKAVTFTGTPGSYTSTTTDATSATFARNTGSNTLESFAQAVMINLCVKCHDGGTQGGAYSTAARVSGGTASQPFGTSAGTVRDVKAHFATTNSSYHPVLGKNNNSYADGTTMVSPWNGITKTDGSTATYGDLITCWDCHDSSAAGRTIGGTTASVTAHGSSTQFRGNTWTSPATLCTVCHLDTTYSKSGGVHSSGSAFAVPIISNMKPNTTNCQYCHASAYTKPDRQTSAADVHGFNALATGGNWPGSNYASRPYAFIRNTEMFLNHRPKQSPEKTNTNGACNLRNGATCSHNNMPTTANDASATYTPGGVY